MSDQVLQNKATLTLDPTDFEGNARKINSALAQIAATARQTNTAFAGLNTSSGSATSRLSSMAAQTQAMRAGMSSLSGALNNSGNAMGALSRRMTALNSATRANTSATTANTAANRATTASITALQASVDQLSQHMARAATTTTQAGNAAQNATGGFGMLGRVMAALSFGILAKEAIQLTDSYRSLQQRLTVTAAGIASSAGAMADVSRIAKDTRANLDDIGLLYAKVANAGKNFGATQTQVARVTETVSKGLRVFGASAAETSSTITQLGQALAAGRLQGDEFRSMTENAPALMDILAKSTGKPRAELKKLGTEGKLTSDIIIRAFGDQSPAIAKLDADFKTLPVTVSESMVLVKNSMEEALGTSESMVNTNKVLSAALQGIANNMTTLIPIVGTLSVAIGVNMVRSMVAARIAAGGLGTALKGALANAAISLGITALIAGLAVLGTQIYESNRKTNMLADANNNAAEGTKMTGLQSLMAARGVASFGGQAGAAAGKLWDMARAARAAAIETAKLNFQKASGEFREQAALTDRGFTRAQEENNNRITDPNASLGERVGALGSSISLGGKKLFAPRQSVVVAARDNAFNRMTDASRALQEASTGTMESYIPSIDAPVSQTDKKKPKGSKSDPVGDFWRGMEQAKTLAGMTGIEVESMTKQFELQNATHRKLNDAEVKRIDSLLAQTRAAKLLSDILDKTVDLRISNASAETALWSKANGATEDQLSLEKSLADFRDKAIKDRISTESDLYRAREAEYKTELQRANDLKSIQRGLDYAATVSPEIKNRNAQNDLDNRRSDLENAFNAPNTTLSNRDYQLAKRGIENDQRKLANTWYTGMAESISGVAELFGQKMGGKIDKLGKLLDGIVKAASGDLSGVGGIGKLAGMFTKRKDGTNNALGDQVSDAMQNQLGSLGRIFGIGNKKTDKVADATNSTAQSSEEIVIQGRKLPGDLAAAMTSAMIGAGIGGAIGGTAGSIAGALGGAALQQFAGKAVGAFAGPLGGIVGGIAGSVLGGLFKSKKQGVSTISFADGVATGGEATGKGSAALKQANALGGSLAGQLNSIADTLGATLGNASVSIGYRPGHKDPAYRVDTGGGGKVTGVKAFESEAEAIAYALKDAINDGVLVGLSDFAGKAVKALDIDAAVSLVGAFKNVTDELDAMADPIGASVRSMNTDLDSLVKQMTKVGASGSDLAKVEELRSKKLAQILEENLSSIRDFQKNINGEGGGVTLSKQLENAQTVFNGFKKDILAGKAVDQEKFTAAGSDVNSLSSQLYGTATSQYQAMRSDLNAVTANLIQNITNAVNGGTASNVVAIDPTTTAISDQTKILAQGQATANEYLAQIAAALKSQTGSSSSSGTSQSVAVNGRVAMY